MIRSSATEIRAESKCPFGMANPSDFGTPPDVGLAVESGMKRPQLACVQGTLIGFRAARMAKFQGKN